MGRILRRDFLKSLVAVPFLGYFASSFKANILTEAAKKKSNYLTDLGIDHIKALEYKLPGWGYQNSKTIRVGIAGYGWRGPVLMRALGHAHPSWINENITDGKYNSELESFLEQEDLNVEFTAVCDTFSPRAQDAVKTSESLIYPGSKGEKRKDIKIFSTFKEMIESREIDAVIIATPDHLHAKMAEMAALAGIHIFLEKPMTRTLDEAKKLREVIKSTKVVFQLGHENRQQRSYEIARELYEKKVLGDVSLVETFTNRNTDFGAWIRGIDKRASLETINWKEFLGDSPWQEFNPDKYFNWQRFNEFGTGVTGSQFSHYYDCVNQIMHLGIPEYVSSLGGTYYFKDPRDIPDVLNCIFNYPKRGLSLTYDCTLKNSKFRGITLMGNEASMEIENMVNVYKDAESSKYKKIEIDPTKTIFSYFPDPRVDAVSSATAMTYIRSGFGKTMVENKILDTTYLHLKEWIDAIRGHCEPSCTIDRGFEEAVTVILSNLSLEHKKTVKWDTEKEEPVFV
ncbi:MAG: Gfo/Idh/MocA family oxidoreductase [Bacteroidales bacterium]